jgi:hypothetical protein
MKTIGRKDHIDLPALNLFDLPAKVDTGAYGCALHSHQMEVVIENDVEMLRFKVLDPSHPEYQDRFFYMESFTTKVVRSSIGIAEKRFAIKTDLALFGKKYKVTFTLTNRKKMKYPVLIGRKFLNNRFIVDVALKNLSYDIKKSLR